jgi:hypothetical protein
MAFPLHTCDPRDACPVLSGAPCEGESWRTTTDRAAFARRVIRAYESDDAGALKMLRAQRARK